MMVIRVLGKNLSENKVLPFALAGSIYGVGIKRAMQICAQAGIDPTTRVKTLEEQDAIRIQNAIKELGFLVASDLQREERNHNRRLASIRCYRWIRRENGLPSRGQRTRSNANSAYNARRT
jgi:small subunit ribosomal protein S13